MSLINDADAAAIAEVRYGAGRGEAGSILVLTLGTGIGSGLICDGRLVPNIELGHIYLRGQDEVAEMYAAARIKVEQGLDWAEYGRRLSEYLSRVKRVFSPRVVILGGGITEDADELMAGIEVDLDLRIAELRNDAGLVGAAVHAEEQAG